MPDIMWSPWRSEYIKKGHEKTQDAEDSIFIQRLNEKDDAKNFILWRGRHVFVIMNLYPYNNGHLLIVPYREVASYEDLTRDEQRAISATIDRCIRWLKHALKPEGFNVGMNQGSAAGAGIPEHLHVHVLPRWSGDTNFMPTTGDVKVVPEALRKSYDKLKSAITAVGDDPRNA